MNEATRLVPKLLAPSHAFRDKILRLDRLIPA